MDEREDEGGKKESLCGAKGNELEKSELIRGSVCVCVGGWR